MDFVITVCPNAAAELQPAWPGRPTRLKWSFRAPGEVAGAHGVVRAAFEEVCGQIESSIREFLRENGFG